MRLKTAYDWNGAETGGFVTVTGLCIVLQDLVRWERAVNPEEHGRTDVFASPRNADELGLTLVRFVVH